MFSTPTLHGGATPLVLLAGLALSSVATTQVQWNRLQTANAPSARYYSGHAYDEARDRIVLFGGNDGSVPVLGDTWLFDGADWKQVATASAPSARQFSSAAYDRQRERVVLFGGMRWTTNYFPWIVDNETWEWDGASWTRRTPAVSPPACASAGFAYDEARNRIVMFGGYAFVDTNGAVVNLDDTWEWDGTSWSKTAPTVRPSRRTEAEMFFDRVRQRVVMTGGTFDNGTGNSVFLTGTWEWDGANWNRLNPALDPIAAPGEKVVYDRARQRAVRYQASPTAQVFEWDGTDWLPRVVAGSKPPRVFPAAVYDGTRQRIVMFSGSQVVPPYRAIRETWSYAPTNPADLSRFGAGCPGSAGVPDLRSTELPWMGGSLAGQLANLPRSTPAILFVGDSQTSHAGFALPWNLAFAGAPGCEVLVALNVGVGLTSVNGVAPWTLIIPSTASLLGQSFFLQSAVFDPPINALGFTFSNAVAAKIGSR